MSDTSTPDPKAGGERITGVVMEGDFPISISIQGRQFSVVQWLPGNVDVAIDMRRRLLLVKPCIIPIFEELSRLPWCSDRERMAWEAIDEVADEVAEMKREREAI